MLQLEDRITPAVAFFENFDNLPAPTLPPGWTTSSTGGLQVWATDTAASFSQPNAANSGPGSTVPNESSLFSPVITVNGRNPVLTFQNRYDLEGSNFGGTSFDLAYLEVSINGGAFTDITTAGGVFTSGGYGSVAGTGFGNLFPGRAGWSGTSGGGFFNATYETCTVDLTNAVGLGSTVQFRWRLVSDSIFSSPGQRIDDVTLNVTPINSRERIAVGSGPGAASNVQVYTFGGVAVASFSPFGGFSGGVRVATGDVTGDGIDDIVCAAGPSGGPGVVVYDGATYQPIRGFLAYDQNFSGGVYVALGDVNGDGTQDIITGAGAGGAPHVKVFNGRTGATLSSFFGPGSIGGFGVSVSAVDFDRDGRSEVVVAGATGGVPLVSILNGRTGALRGSYLAYDGPYDGGVTLASGDLNGDGFQEVITGTATSFSHVKAFNFVTGQFVSSFFAYPAGFQGGITVATSDLLGTGTTEIVTGSGVGSSGSILRFDAAGRQTEGFQAFDFGFLGGAFVG